MKNNYYIFINQEREALKNEDIQSSISFQKNIFSRMYFSYFLYL